MGCHTWFYNRLEKQPIYEEVRELYLSFLKRNVKELREELTQLRENPNYLILEEVQRQLNVCERIERIVESGLCKVATLKRYGDCIDDDIVYSDKTKFFYKSINRFHDMFRVYDYPMEQLLSEEETLNFLRSKNIDISKEVLGNIEKFDNLTNDFPLLYFLV